MLKTKLKLSGALRITLAAGLIAGALGTPGTGHAVSLKERSIVSDTAIKVSDIFDGISAEEDKVLGAAPRPGHEMVLNARTLMRIAIALDLPWRPGSNADYVVLTRAATVIDQTMIEDGLRTALAERGVDGAYNLLLTAGSGDIILPEDQAASVEIDRLQYDPEKGTVKAVLYAPSRENPLKTQEISARIERLVEVPVLRGALRNGDVIGKNDLDFITLRESTVKPDVLARAEDLIGTTPRRALTPGKPVLANEVESPRIVKRGELITLTYLQGGLALTAQGKALQDGAQGDIVRVLNTASNKTIEGIVTASQEVQVRTN